MSNKIAVFTIVSNNYIAYAKTLMQSLELFNDNWDRYVVLVDDINNLNMSGNNFKVIPLDYLNIPDLENFLLRYDILEVNTAVKPWAFSRLFSIGYDKVIYFDPDIEVYRRLTDIEASLDGNLMVITPHLLDSVKSGDDFDDLKIINAGSYNLGFLALSKHKDLDKFLTWWKSKLEFFCINNQKEGYFVDQKWMELSPSLFDGVIISKNRGYNVAYWNLPERAGEYISFFHFSGLDINDNKYLSRHRKRLLIANCGESIVYLVKSYRNKILANGYESTKGIKYQYQIESSINTHSGVYLNDIRIDGKYAWIDKSMKIFILPSSETITLHLLYISQYYISSPKISIYINSKLVIEEVLFTKNFTIKVPVIKNTISELKIESDSSFIPSEHLQNNDNRIISIGIWKITSDRETLINFETPISNTTQLESGFNLIGNAKSETGVGQVLRSIAKSIDDTGIKYSIIDWSNKLSKNIDDSMSYRISDKKIYDTNIFFINGCHRLTNIFDKSLFKDSYNIGYWCWETENVPDSWYDNEDILDEIWTLSTFCHRAISKKSNVPVIVVTPQVQFKVNNAFDKRKYKIDDSKFKFLFIYDTFSYKERKNPYAVIESFLLAKKDSRFNNAVLIVKTNSDELNRYISDDIIVINEVMSRQDIYELHNVSDCFVSLHRSEGLGFNIIESAHLGKEIIATGWSGNVEFLTGDNINLVDYKLIKIGNDYGPYHKDDIWAEPNIEHAAEIMVRVLLKGSKAIKLNHRYESPDVKNTIIDRYNTRINNH